MKWGGEPGYFVGGGWAIKRWGGWKTEKTRGGGFKEETPKRVEEEQGERILYKSREQWGQGRGEEKVPKEKRPTKRV